MILISEALPERWIQMIRDTIAGLAPKVVASRMLRQYVTQLLHPCCGVQPRLELLERGAEALASWKRRIRSGLARLFRLNTSSRSPASRSRWGRRFMSARWFGSGSSPRTTSEVQLIIGRLDGDDHLYDPRVDPFPAGVNIDGGLRRYEGWVEAKRAGAIGYTVRVVPYHPLLASQAEMGLAVLPASTSTPTY